MRIDNRLVTTLPADHLQDIARLARQGIHVATASPGEVYESATATCVHCHTIVVLNPQRTRPRGYCGRCHAYTCDNPTCNTDCRPMAKVIDHIQEHYARFPETAGSTLILP